MCIRDRYYPIWREKTYAAEDEKTLPQDCCKPRYVIVDGIAHPYTKYSQLPDAFTLRYEAYPADIPDNAPDETEFDLPDEAVLAVIFFAAAQTQSMEYDQRFFQSFYAVSYTHLDVYKRQGKATTLILRSLHHSGGVRFFRRRNGSAENGSGQYGRRGEKNIYEPRRRENGTANGCLLDTSPPGDGHLLGI